MCKQCSQNLKLETFSNSAMLVEYVQVSVSHYDQMFALILVCINWPLHLSIHKIRYIVYFQLNKRYIY